MLHILCYFFTGNIWRIFSSYSAEVRMLGISVLFFDSCFQIDLFSRIRYIRLTLSTTALFRSIVFFYPVSLCLLSGFFVCYLKLVEQLLISTVLQVGENVRWRFRKYPFWHRRDMVQKTVLTLYSGTIFF